MKHVLTDGRLGLVCEGDCEGSDSNALDYIYSRWALNIFRRTIRDVTFERRDQRVFYGRFVDLAFLSGKN